MAGLSTCWAKREKVSQPTECDVLGGTPGTSRSSRGGVRYEKFTGGAFDTAEPTSMNSCWRRGGEGGGKGGQTGVGDG